MTEIILGQDARVARWMFEVSNSRPMQINAAIGLADGTGNLVGGIAFTSFNGSDIECHFVGPGTLSRRVVRLIFGIAVMQFNLNRLTVHTRKKSMARGVTKLGAKFECVCKRLYGPTDAAEHAGRRYYFPRETMEKLAGLKDDVSETNPRRIDRVA
jgi:hypothetical protein